MTWQTLTLSLPAAQIEPLSDLFNDMGALAVTLATNTTEELFEPPLNETPLWERTTLQALFEVTADLSALLPILEKAIYPEKLQVQIATVADQNWQAHCQAAFKPLCFADRLWIYPSWQPPEIDDNKPRVLLDPGLAFGTGAHPTTALCVDWLARTIQGGEVVIDYGCGSGILALAALKLGARKVWAVDNDPQALEATHDNIKRNACDYANIKIVLPDALPALHADILVANILANPLISLAPYFAALMRPDGKIALSGILAEQAEQVMHAYQPWFTFSPIVQQEQWIRLTGVKKHDNKN